MMRRRRGPGLVRMAAGTAVIAGTAGAVRHHQEQKYANQAAEQQAEQQARRALPPQHQPPVSQPHFLHGHRAYHERTRLGSRVAAAGCGAAPSC